MFEFKFSIIITTYDSNENIKLTIDSILSQSIGFKDNVELIIVNNGENIGDIDSYTEKYPNNIKLINNENPLNKSASRNLAIDLVKGEFISFLDCGDSISKQTLSSVFKTFNENLNIDLISIPIYIGEENRNHILNYKFKELSDIHIDVNNNVVLSDNEYNLNIYDEDLDDVLSSSDLFNLHLFSDTKNKNFNQDTLSLDDNVILLDETYNLKLYEEDNDELVLSGSGVNTFKDVSIVNLNEFPQVIQISANSGFFRSNSIGEIRFDENIDAFADCIFINEILLRNPILALISNISYHMDDKNLDESVILTEVQKEGIHSIHPKNSKEYFKARFNDFYFKLIEKSINYYGHVMEFIQYTIAFDLQDLLKIGSVEGILNNIEFKELYFNLIELLSYINDEIILAQVAINQSLKSHILLLKHFNYGYLATKNFKFNSSELNSEFIDNLSYSKLQLSYKQMNLFKRLVKEDPMYIDSYEIKDDVIYISGIYTSFFDLDLDIVVDLNNTFESISCDKLYYPQRDFYSLNCPYCYNHYFKVKIPLINKNNAIQLDSSDDFILSFSFRVVLNENIILEEYDGFINDNSYDLQIDFSKSCNMSKISKYQLNDDYISEINNNELIVTKRNKFKLLKLESKNLFKIFTNKEKGKFKASSLRELYFIYKEFKSKPIWIFVDDLDNKGNAFKLCEYGDSRDNIKKYYVLNKDSKEFKETKKEVNVLENKSFKHNILTLLADKIISSTSNNEIIYPFWDDFEYFAGFINSELIVLDEDIKEKDISKKYKSIRDTD